VELHVAFLPEEIGAPDHRVAVVIDVLRATTSVLVLVERGCEEVCIAPSIDAARRYRSAHVGVLAAGEQGGRAPAGFDLGNSPVAFAQSDVAGRRVVLATTNGTRALHLVRAAPVCLLGCLRNRSATARAAVSAAYRQELDVAIICAGREGRFSLDDAYTAGAIVDAAIAGSSGADHLGLTDAALAARALYCAHPDAGDVFRAARAGRHLIEIGLAEDIPYCAEPDRSSIVPRVGERIRLLDA
jgi:2-phosphosulfolactate phosphatase